MFSRKSRRRDQRDSDDLWRLWYLGVQSMTLSVSVLGTEGTSGEAVGGREEQQQQQQQQLPAIALHPAEEEGGSPDNSESVSAEPPILERLPEVPANVHSPDVGSAASSEGLGLETLKSTYK